MRDKMRDEDIKQFKRDLASYNYFKSSGDYWREQIKEIEEELYTLKAVRMGEGGGKSSGVNDRTEALIDRKTELEAKARTAEKSATDIDKKLSELTAEERDILKLVYMEHCPIWKISKLYYVSTATMYRRINSIINRIC